MIVSEAQKFLNDHEDLHDSIITECKITNSAYIDKDGSIVYKKNTASAVDLNIASQKGYQVQVKLRGVTTFKLQDFHELIIYRVVLKTAKDRVFFSLTGGFDEGHMWFECSDIELK